MTTRAHLMSLIADLQAEMKALLYAGRFQAANDLRPELAWLAGELGKGRYQG